MYVLLLLLFQKRNIMTPQAQKLLSLVNSNINDMLYP